ncbi:MAG: hypothetical protein ACE5KX_01060 [Acidimicrobiia bacterium]
MRTLPYRTGEYRRDWKVTLLYRVLLQLGWGVLCLSLVGLVVGIALDVPEAWWASAGLAVVALLTRALLPEPLPSNLITGSRNWIAASRDF